MPKITQLERLLSRLAGSLIKVNLLLMKNLLTSLAISVFTVLRLTSASSSAADAEIREKFSNWG